jgi:uncharacterized protein
MGESTTGPLVRRLTGPDEPAIRECLYGDRGFGLFVACNLLSYGFSSGVCYWGQYRSHADALPEAILMIVGGSANIYASSAVDITPLARVALHEPLRFIMGREDLMAPIETIAGKRIRRAEAHHFADLPAQRFARQLVRSPADALVRRGRTQDIDGLARLYFGAPGFEDLSLGQIRNVMLDRVTHLRTCLVERDGTIIAAASTSAESYTAAMIGGVWTAPAARGRGYGTAVVATLCADLLRERIKPYLFFLIDNGPAEHMYTKIGFRVIGNWKVIFFGKQA